MYRVYLCVALMFAFSACLISQSRAATQTMKTTITLEVLSCEGCARNVAAKLLEIRGVSNVKTDLKTKSATVIPKAEASLSPRQLWEAVEKAGKKPIKLQGPSGTFTSKPKM